MALSRRVRTAQPEHLLSSNSYSASFSVNRNTRQQRQQSSKRLCVCSPTNTTRFASMSWGGTGRWGTFDSKDGAAAGDSVRWLRAISSLSRYAPRSTKTMPTLYNKQLSRYQRTATRLKSLFLCIHFRKGQVEGVTACTSFSWMRSAARSTKNPSSSSYSSLI